MRVERTTEIAAPPERVYELVMDPRRLADWVTIHRALVDAPDGQLARGSELVQELHLAGSSFRVHWTVVEDDRPARVVWEGRGPLGARARVVYSIEARGQRTRFSYLNEYELPGGPLGRLAGPAVRRVTARVAEGSLQRLKALLE
jgi:carbon monoxide dehydrogenase subunit G